MSVRIWSKYDIIAPDVPREYVARTDYDALLAQAERMAGAAHNLIAQIDRESPGWDLYSDSMAERRGAAVEALAAWREFKAK